MTLLLKIMPIIIIVTKHMKSNTNAIAFRGTLVVKLRGTLVVKLGTRPDFLKIYFLLLT